MHAADENHATTGAESGREEVFAVAGTLWVVEIHELGRVAIAGTVRIELKGTARDHGDRGIAVRRGLDGGSSVVATDKVLGRDCEKVLV